MSLGDLAVRLKTCPDTIGILQHGGSWARLLGGYLHHPHFRELMVPLRRDAFQSEAKRFSLTRTQRRSAEVDRVRIRAGGLKDVEGEQFIPDNLPHVVLEHDANYRMSQSLVTRVYDNPIKVGHRGAHKASRRAHLQVGHPELVSMRRSTGARPRLVARRQAG